MNFSFTCGKLTPPGPACSENLGGRIWRAAHVLNFDPTQIYASLLMRPWVIQARHLKSVLPPRRRSYTFHARALYWWIGMKVCARW